uniref:Uncharacterized protein n=1 Tax=Arion vulgaris TaxID=1028688 RepID=A0A0B6ZIW4_9EUPU
MPGQSSDLPSDSDSQHVRTLISYQHFILECHSKSIHCLCKNWLNLAEHTHKISHDRDEVST